MASVFFRKKVEEHLQFKKNHYKFRILRSMLFAASKHNNNDRYRRSAVIEPTYPSSKLTLINRDRVTNTRFGRFSL